MLLNFFTLDDDRSLIEPIDGFSLDTLRSFIKLGKNKMLLNRTWLEQPIEFRAEVNS